MYLFLPRLWCFHDHELIVWRSFNFSDLSPVWLLRCHFSVLPWNSKVLKVNSAAWFQGGASHTLYRMHPNNLDCSNISPKSFLKTLRIGRASQLCKNKHAANLLHIAHLPFIRKLIVLIHIKSHKWMFHFLYFILTWPLDTPIEVGSDRQRNKWRHGPLQESTGSLTPPYSIWDRIPILYYDDFDY